jgi:hypothetical protein
MINNYKEHKVQENGITSELPAPKVIAPVLRVCLKMLVQEK